MAKIRSNSPGTADHLACRSPRVAAILHQHSEEESGSKRWPLDAMNMRHAAVTWLSTVGIGSIRVRRFARGWRPCNGVGMRSGAADGLCELHRSAKRFANLEAVGGAVVGGHN